MSIHIIDPGLSTTVQDGGRFGFYHVGIPQSGAADQFSYHVANALVGNHQNDAVLECTYAGPEFTVTQHTEIAVTGAPCRVTINDRSYSQWTRLHVRPDDVVNVSDVEKGMRTYIAFRGGIAVPEVLGSRSTYLLGGIGGLDGRRLQAGDSLPLGEPTRELPRLLYLAPRLRPTFGDSQEVRVLLGLYDHYLTAEGRRNLLEHDWVLTATADRMGLRYDGPGVEWADKPQYFGAGADPSNIVDAGYAVGSIQIPGGTQPIILHRDAVSGGGYAMVATVISADLDVIARAAPGTKTRFVEVDMEQALAQRAENRRIIAELIAG